MNKEIKKIPLLITKGIYFFPKLTKKIKFKDEYYLNFFKYIQKNKFESKILIVSQKKRNENIKNLENIYNIGVIVKFKIISNEIKKEVELSISSISRVKIFDFLEERGIYYSNFEILKDNELTIEERKKLSEKFFNKIKSVNKELAEKFKSHLFKSSEISEFIYSAIEGYSSSKENLKQKALETDNIFERYRFLESFDKFEKLNFSDLMKIIDVQINDIVKNKLSDQQRIFLLKEKMKAIKKQLGEFDTKTKSISSYLKRLSTEDFPQHIKEKMEEEISKFQSLHPSSGEASILKNYIDWVMSLPWFQTSRGNEDLKKVKKILDLNHFGLKKPKEAIIEHLAMNIFSKKNIGQILCLIGPPGVGKTSLGISIAKALDKKYVRISLGGVKDESEIRGHRRTYLGAMPGKIIKAMKKAGIKNPLILIDEIDKLSSDYRGDPSSAMLEVLDPEQNSTFIDNYIEESFDLSNVTFVATANYEFEIPSPLRDRMEMIRLSSYTEIEKLKIAKDYLIPKLFKKLKLDFSKIEFEESAIEEIIKYYTREAGVRELGRLINKICRKIIVIFLLKKTSEKTIINSKNIKKFLGSRFFEHTSKNKKSEIGVVTGLAYTQYGGDILPIETTKFSGSGKLILTGKLGEVMRESANIALNFIKSNAKIFNIKIQDFNKNDIHIHVPEGAVPKDGPSAGITLTTALISLFKNKVISKEIGMTGEITLTGKVLPIGGLKEKSISAARSRLKTIFIPKENKKDLIDIPKEVKEKLEIIFVSEYLDVYLKLFKD